MMKPCKEFYCDKCGKIIESPADGYFEFEKNEHNKNYGFKIVHNKRECFFDLSSSTDLATIVGPDGLGRLLSWIHVGPITDPENTDESLFADNVEFAEVFKRLHLPYYEEARFYLERACSEGYIDGNYYGSHCPEKLRGIITVFLNEDNEDL